VERSIRLGSANANEPWMSLLQWKTEIHSGTNGMLTVRANMSLKEVHSIHLARCNHVHLAW